MSVQLGSGVVNCLTRVSLGLAVAYGNEQHGGLTDEQALRFWLFWPDFPKANLLN